MPDMTRGQTALIRQTADDFGCLPVQTAYLLATAAWETAGSLEPVKEAYFLGSKAAAYRDGLRYAPWWGRGFVQLTWQRNYILAGQKLDMDLTTDPDRVMEPEISAQILVQGSMEGWFTGKALPLYVSATACDFRGARRVINGTDRADDIAALAQEYLSAIAPSIPRTVRRGSTGVPVAQLQSALRIPADGAFGPQTEMAVIDFQAAHGLAPDGIVGPATWRAILNLGD
ncbi:peptidoglycan-binding protein [Frigidibacter sp. MR17.24]|uniref:peptidoglycan-binding protein n=1 Tax=Frigidibacter sp. MR17.24 TaxID=3127345 RepID=UPI003012D725